METIETKRAIRQEMLTLFSLHDRWSGLPKTLIVVRTIRLNAFFGTRRIIRRSLKKYCVFWYNVKVNTESLIYYTLNRLTEIKENCCNRWQFFLRIIDYRLSTDNRFTWPATKELRGKVRTVHTEEQNLFTELKRIAFYHFGNLKTTLFRHSTVKLARPVFENPNAWHAVGRAKIITRFD